LLRLSWRRLSERGRHVEKNETRQDVRHIAS
jgi:hypothetical protein